MYLTRNTDFEYLAHYRKLLGPNWQGRFVTGLQSLDPMIPWQGRVPELYDTLRKLVHEHPEWGVEYQDQ